ncbi:MAG TPA: class I SAM-dependent methyltransferase [Candidatus Acidoferrum sp.]|nr:class I SAM-dependent methyltransferase [Candidatus Acidoferrum sp.]
MPSWIENCVLCGGTRNGFHSFAAAGGWRYVRCCECGLVFLDPQPTHSELEHFYNHSYRYDLRRYKDSIPEQRVWLDLLEKFCGHPGRLLEVGCSYGYFLTAARRQGWSVHGVELSEEAVHHACNELGLPVQKGRILDVLAEKDSSFDTIVAWHVLEHDPVPRVFLERAYDLLCPGGILALRVPNLGSTVAKLSGSFWQWLSPPEHVCMYTAKTLSRLLVQCGFEILTSRTARGNARNMWFEILRARVKKAASEISNGHTKANQQFRFSPPAVYQDRAWYRAVEKVVSIGTMPVDWFAARWMLNHGKEAELAMFARKPASESGVQVAVHSHCERISPL